MMDAHSLGDGVWSRGLASLVAQLREVRAGRRSRVVVPAGDPEMEALGAELNHLLAARPSSAPGSAEAAGGEHSVLEDIIASVPHSIFWKDFEGRFLGGNQNLLNDLGLTGLDQLVGRTDHELGVPREHADFYRSCDLDVLRSGRALLDIEESQDQADGTHTLLTSKVPLRDAMGRVSGLLGIYVDITERKRMEEALRLARDDAE